MEQHWSHPNALDPIKYNFFASKYDNYLDLIKFRSRLYNEKIIHKDIKPGNIFYKFNDDKIDVKIADLDCIAFEKRNVCSYTKKYTNNIRWKL